MVLEQIIKMVAEQFMVDESEITPETSFIDDLGADSLDLAELMVTIEDEFGIVITDESVHQLRTVEQITDFVDGLLK